MSSHSPDTGQGRPADPPVPPANGAEAALEDARTKRAFLAHMRHELRTPINAIIGYSELLIEDSEDLPEYGPFVPDLQRILTSGRQLLDLVGQVLDPAKIEERTEIDLEEYGVKVHHAMRTPITAVVGYCELLAEDLGEGELEELTGDLGKIRSSAESMLSYINAILTLSRENPEDVELELGSAATRKVAQVISSIAPIGEAEAVATDAGRVLVVDDNATNRQLLRRRLERQGHTVMEAENGSEGVAALAERGPFDLALLDIIMPVMNGYEVLQRMKGDPAFKHIPVIMLTSLDEIDSVVACIEAGADDYLTRPINPVILNARIGACLEKKRLRDREQEYLEQIRVERDMSERLLLNILPGPIAQRLKAREGIIVDQFPETTVLFSDLVGFTRMTTEVSPEELIRLLNVIFSAFDRLAQRHGLEKIKTIGDAYMAVAGLLDGRQDHAEMVADFALDMLGEIKRISERSERRYSLRIGINTGPVIAGVIGKSKFIYDLWGDTVNTASRMESHGEEDSIHVSEATYLKLRDKFVLRPRGPIQVKGKGEMTTYFLTGRR